MAAATSAALISGLFMMQILAAPPPQNPIPPEANLNGYGFGAQDDGRPSSPGREPAKRPEGNGSPAEPSHALGPHDCRTLSSNVQVCTPERGDGEAAKVSPAELALTKWTQLPVPTPAVRTAPPRRAAGLVGLPHWFWVTNWRPVSGRASARDVWVEVTARPQSMAIDPGPGHRVVRCAGPGTAYDRSRSAASQRTDCSYTFSRSSALEPGGAYRVRVSVTWGGTWRGSDGSGGALPPVTRSTTFRLRVAEAQGLYGQGAG